ncbi:hypothetical protein F4818DRAFT_404678 [Hypoxylon cercidicola]|nr:hypothetical protein F4818DRAFT_404678 [Hypoxylon cercidicola]
MWHPAGTCSLRPRRSAILLAIVSRYTISITFASWIQVSSTINRQILFVLHVRFCFDWCDSLSSSCGIIYCSNILSSSSAIHSVPKLAGRVQCSQVRNGRPNQTCMSGRF